MKFTLSALAVSLPLALPAVAEKPEVNIRGFLDVYYGYDFNDGPSDRRPGFLFNHTTTASAGLTERPLAGEPAIDRGRDGSRACRILFHLASCAHRGRGEGMKELFREPDIVRVKFFQGVLEAEGIATMIRNELLTTSGLSEIPIPEFFPALCVMNDVDYPKAMLLIREVLTAEQGSADVEKICGSCGEGNPGNFEICWACGGIL